MSIFFSSVGVSFLSPNFGGFVQQYFSLRWIFVRFRFLLTSRRDGLAIGESRSARCAMDPAHLWRCRSAPPLLVPILLDRETKCRRNKGGNPTVYGSNELIHWRNRLSASEILAPLDSSRSPLLCLSS